MSDFAFRCSIWLRSAYSDQSAASPAIRQGWPHHSSWAAGPLTTNLSPPAGSLPPSWSTSTGMQSINVANNQLTGPLPASYSSMAGLQQMNVANNQIVGPTPTSYTIAPGLQNV